MFTISNSAEVRDDCHDHPALRQLLPSVGCREKDARNKEWRMGSQLDLDTVFTRGWVGAKRGYQELTVLVETRGALLSPIDASAIDYSPAAQTLIREVKGQVSVT